MRAIRRVHGAFVCAICAVCGFALPAAAQTATATPAAFATPVQAANRCQLVQAGPVISGSTDNLALPAEYNFAGDAVVVGVNLIYPGGPAPALTISDANGAAGCLASSCPPAMVPGGTMDAYECAAIVPADGAAQFTVSNPAHNTIAMSAGLLEVEGASYSIDSIGACAEGNSSSAIAPPIAPPHADDFVLGGCVADAASALSASGPPAPWTALNRSVAPGAALLPGYANGATGSLSAAYSISPASPFICQSFSIYCGAAQPLPTPMAAGAPILRPWKWNSESR
ncbi:MAG: hypothetical protein ACREQI_11830 [Candidatus Binataceae bacterium]